MYKIDFKDIKVVDSHQFPEGIKQVWHEYVNSTVSLSNDIYVCFNNEIYGDDDIHDRIAKFLIEECLIADESLLISRWW